MQIAFSSGRNVLEKIEGGGLKADKHASNHPPTIATPSLPPLRMTGRGRSYNNSLCHKAKLHFDRNFTLPRGKTSLAKQTSPIQEILRLRSG